MLKIDGNKVTIKQDSNNKMTNPEIIVNGTDISNLILGLRLTMSPEHEIPVVAIEFLPEKLEMKEVISIIEVASFVEDESILEKPTELNELEFKVDADLEDAKTELAAFEKDLDRVIEKMDKVKEYNE